MRRYIDRKLAAAVVISAAVLLLGCTEDVYFDGGKENQPPTVRLTNGPLEGNMTLYQVHFYWVGYDPDGIIERYEYTVVSGDPVGFDPADTTGIDKWISTERSDLVFKVSADSLDSNVTIGNNPYTLFRRTHTLFVRAVDNDGLSSKAAFRSFTAFTLAPHIFINEPVQLNPGSGMQFLGPVIHFRWEGKDPLDTPWNYQDVDSIRYLHTHFSGFVLERLNQNPEIFENLWSPWISYDAPGDSGKATTLGDDETMELAKSYIFAVQAKDEAGAISSIFDAGTNVRCFMVMEPTGPLITAYEPYHGTSKFIGTISPTAVVYTPAGLPINYSWNGDASQYGSTVSTYRYGWDVKDLDNPSDWAVDPSPYHKAAPERRFYSGIHSLYIEAVDNIGTQTIGKIEINIVPLVMDRDLLWVDDFLSDDFPQISYMMPTESEHDAFWINICSRAEKFDPDIDVYDTNENSFRAPSIHQIWRYKNVIWSYGSARWDFNTWMQMMEYVAESDLESAPYTYNLLQYYQTFGGHLWTEGKSDREGGLSASLPRRGYYNHSNSKILIFPLYLKCEMITGPGYGCEDTSGVKTFPYKNYCVSMLDRAYGVLRGDAGMPIRNIDWDAMSHAVVDTRDILTTSNPDLPAALHLWDKVTRTGMFFDPSVRGFHYIELYDPKYWMQRNGFESQSCFHPMYRMKARNTRSAINDAVIAFWSTKYADIRPDVPGTVAAPSVHFGMPLWFFDRDEVNALADVIFREWNILKAEYEQP
ncbi:MAG TPA: hypothetical protein VMX58_00375 [Patescibacteria group bacterium]|nr:hypothetical protein [Patescibacteria group bacterium]